MVRPSRKPNVLRVAHMEGLEPRMVLAAEVVPVTSLAAGATKQLDLESSYGNAQQQAIAWAHQLGLTGAGQTVAVIDTGVAYDHPALGGGFGSTYRVVGGWDFSEENDGDPYDDPPSGSHGTHVAGIIAGNDPQYSGVAPEADLVALRVFNDRGRSDFEWIEQALQWVHDHQHDFEHPITTVNVSIGTLPEDQPRQWRMLEDEFRQLHDDGIFIAVAAGNDFEKLQTVGLDYPADSRWVIPVGSVDANGELSQFSQRDRRILVAPGEHIRSTATDYLHDFNGRTDDYSWLTGTSMATPFVAGAAVLLRQAMRQAGQTRVTQDQIERVLRDTAVQIDDPATGLSFARVDLQAALSSVLPQPSLVKTLEIVRNGSSEVTVSVADSARQVSVVLDATAFHVTVDEVQYHVDRRQTESLKLVVAATTSVDLTGTSAPDLALLRATTSELIGTDYRILVQGSRQINVRGGNGSNDRAQLYGSLGDETFYGTTGTATLRSTRFRTTVNGFETVLAFSGGGNDVAYLHGSAESEILVRSDDYARLSTPTGLNLVEGFSRVFAYARPGGVDRAFLQGTADSESVMVTPEFARWTTDSRLVFAESFDQVYATAVAGGLDLAYLHGSASRDRFHGSPTSGRLVGQQHLAVADDFDRVYAFGNGGADVAVLEDSNDDDLFVSFRDHAFLGGADFLNYAEGFATVYAVSSRGRDEARVHDESETLDLILNAREAVFSARAYSRRLRAFDVIYAKSLVRVTDLDASLTDSKLGLRTLDSFVWTAEGP